MRPGFHFTATQGWINDPHGITYHGGKYHLFYQYLPDRLEWGSSCHWAHATSPDLITFEHRPIALSPGDGDHGIWTGSLVAEQGSATIFYTSVSENHLDAGRVRIAHPVDESWDTWEKGPVVVDTPTDRGIVAFRDPFVVKEDDHWRIFVGASSSAGDALALTYLSQDGVHWREDGVALSSAGAPESQDLGSMWECPQFFELDGHHVMVTSVMDRGMLTHAIYALGVLSEGRFQARRWGQLSFGTSYYAPSFFLDATGRPSVLFWMRDVMDLANGWRGAHSVPFTLHVIDDVLVATPSEALLAYRGELSETGEVGGVAADCLWSLATSLMIRSGESEVASLKRERDSLVLSRGEEHWSMPCTDTTIRVIVDGPVLEVVTLSGLMGCPINPSGPNLTFSTDSGELSVWPLQTL